MISYLGSLVQFSPARGRAGRCRQTSLCVGSTPRVLATLGLPLTGVSVLSPSTLLRLPAALYGAGPALSAVPVLGSSTKARIWLGLRFVPSPAWAVQAARGLGALSPAWCAFPLRGEQPGQPEVCAASPRAWHAFSLRGERLGQPEAWRTLPWRGTPFPSAAPARAVSRASGILQIRTGACLPGGRGWLLWG